MAIMMRRRTSIAVAPTAVAVCLLAALTSCSSDNSDASTADGRPGGTGSSSASAPTRTATPSPSPTGPCADGTCEIKVAIGDIVTVPETYGLGPIKVTAIDPDKVDMAAELTGSGYSVSGCSGGGSVTSQGKGGVALSCSKGPAATINNAMSLKVVDIQDRTAVLRIKPTG
jgi:hypothetical protein